MMFVKEFIVRLQDGKNRTKNDEGLVPVIFGCKVRYYF